MLISTQTDKYLTLVCAIDTQDDSIDNMLKYEKQLNLFFRTCLHGNRITGQVWILFGYEKNSDQAEALQVGQSTEAGKELTDLLKPMYNALYQKRKEEKYNLDDLTGAKTSATVGGGSYFYKSGIYDKKQYLYRFLFRKYERLEFYKLDIDGYLNVSSALTGNEKVIYDLAKDYYAEAKLAVESEAKYWNYYNSGIDARTYKYLINHKEKCVGSGEERAVDMNCEI